jgi:hypothetical protein
MVGEHLVILIVSLAKNALKLSTMVKENIEF